MQNCAKRTDYANLCQVIQNCAKTMQKLCKNVQNVQKCAKSCKIVQNVQNSAKCAKLCKICTNCAKYAKLCKIEKNYANVQALQIVQTR